jgi:hypothetical protein
MNGGAAPMAKDEVAMELIVQLDGFAARFVFEWQALQVGPKPCYMWEYTCLPKPREDEPVIYRHVLKIRSAAGVVPIYIGEGRSLAGPEEHNLCYQYRGPHGIARQRVRTYIGSRTENGWTELLRMQSPVINLSEERIRRFLQAIFIAAEYWRHEELSRKYSDLPQFLNEPP